jgi:hypothetical protein
MLYNSKSIKKKMHPVYRRPFVVVRPRGFYGKLYYLWQVNGIAIPRSFYKDHLKPFKLQTGYLVTGFEQQLLIYQNLCIRKAKYKLLKLIRKGIRAWLIKD